MTSAWWTTRSMRAVAQVAFGKMVGQSRNARLVVSTRLFFLVASADDLEEEVCVSVVEGEKADLVDDEQADLRGVAKTAIEGARRLLCGEVEQELRGRQEEHAVSREDGLVRDVLGDHGLAEPLRRDEHDVASRLEEVEAHDGLDERSLDLRGPVPVEVGHGLESLEAAACATPIEPASGAVLLLDVDHVLKELLRAPSLLGRQRDQIIESAAVASRPRAWSRAFRLLIGRPPALNRGIRRRGDRSDGARAE